MGKGGTRVEETPAHNQERTWHLPVLFLLLVPAFFAGVMAFRPLHIPGTQEMGIPVTRIEGTPVTGTGDGGGSTGSEYAKPPKVPVRPSRPGLPS
jgi:hypothetical protein